MRWEGIDGEVITGDEQVGKPALRVGQAGPPQADRWQRLKKGDGKKGDRHLATDYFIGVFWHSLEASPRFSTDRSGRLFFGNSVNE